MGVLPGEGRDHKEEGIGEPEPEPRTEVYKDVWFLPRGQAHTVEVVGGLPRMMLYELK